MTNRSLDTNWTIGNYYKNRYREVDDYYRSRNIRWRRISYRTN